MTFSDVIKLNQLLFNKLHRFSRRKQLWLCVWYTRVTDRQQALIESQVPRPNPSQDSQRLNLEILGRNSDMWKCTHCYIARLHSFRPESAVIVGKQLRSCRDSAQTRTAWLGPALQWVASGLLNLNLARNSAMLKCKHSSTVSELWSFIAEKNARAHVRVGQQPGSRPWRGQGHCDWVSEWQWCPLGHLR